MFDLSPGSTETDCQKFSWMQMRFLLVHCYVKSARTQGGRSMGADRLTLLLKKPLPGIYEKRKS